MPHLAPPRSGRREVVSIVLLVSPFGALPEPSDIGRDLGDQVVGVVITPRVTTRHHVRLEFRADVEFGRSRILLVQRQFAVQE